MRIRRGAMLTKEIVKDTPPPLVFAGLVHGRLAVARCVGYFPRRAGDACQAGPLEGGFGFFHCFFDAEIVAVAVAAAVDVVAVG